MTLASAITPFIKLNKPTQLKRARRSPSFSLYFSHHIPLLDGHSPSMVREGFIAVTVPQENLSGTVITASKGSPATLGYPSTHPSFLDRKGPLPSGSSTQRGH